MLKPCEISDAIFSKAQEGIICYQPLKDENGRVVDFIFLALNDAAVNILNAPRETFLGQKFLPLFPGSVESGLYGTFVKAAENKQVEEIEFSYKDENYEGWYKDIVIPHEDLLLVYFSNITEKKLLELNLAERTRQLENTKNELSKSLNEKETLLREIHHRIKNNLQMVSSLISLQSHVIQDAASLKIFKETQNRINSIALIHQKLYQEKTFGSVNFSIYLKDIIASVFHAYQVNNSKIKLTQEIEDLQIGIEKGISLGLIFNEMITNAIKYAFPENRNGYLYISVKNVGHIEIIVADNGVGLPENLNIYKTESIGMQLITSLTEQLGGKIEVDNSKGVRYTIVLPGI